MKLVSILLLLVGFLKSVRIDDWQQETADTLTDLFILHDDDPSAAYESLGAIYDEQIQPVVEIVTTDMVEASMTSLQEEHGSFPTVEDHCTDDQNCIAEAAERTRAEIEAEWLDVFNSLVQDVISAKIKVRAMIEAGYWESLDCMDNSTCYDPCVDVEVVVTETETRMTEIEREITLLQEQKAVLERELIEIIEECPSLASDPQVEADF